MSNIIKYNSSSNVLYFPFPLDWKAENLSALSISITDMEGTSIFSHSVTLQPNATLATAASRYATSITINTGYTSTFKAGQAIKLVGPLGSEVQIVKGYKSSTKAIELEAILRNSYDSGNSVYPLSVEYTLDTTDTNIFVNTGEYKVTWLPVGTGQPTSEIYEILTESLQIEGFVPSFKSLYPRAYDALSNPANRLDEVLQAAEERVYTDLMSDNLDIYKIKDQRFIKPIIMACVAYLWSLNADIEIEDERKELKSDYYTRIGTLKKMSIWTDDNDDSVKDDNETQSHETFFERTW